MRFAFVSTMTGGPWGGSEVLWHNSAQALARAGEDVSVAYPKWPETPAAIQRLREESGAEVWEYPRWIELWEKAARRARAGAALGLASLLKSRWLRSVRPTLVCVSSGQALEGIEWMRVCSAQGVPFVTLAQAHAEFLWPSDDEARLARDLFDGAERCFFVSEGNRRLVRTQLATDLSNSEVVSNFGGSLWSASLPWPDTNDGVWRLACIGRLHPASKGQDLVIEVMAADRWRSRPLEITFFGEGPQEETLRRLVRMVGLERQVRFGGHVRDIRQVWANQHALVLPSRYEGLPLVLVEAMMCGRPAIVTDVAGNAEVIRDGATGFVAEAATAKHLDRALEAAWQARAAWQNMGQAARDFVHQALPRDPGEVFAHRLLDIASRLH